METFTDHEFRTPAEKAAPFDPGLPTSKLSVLSLVFGILGITVLPVVGSIIAIATGKAAQDQIRDSGGRLEGRENARVGLALGWLSLLLAAAVVLIAACFLFSMIPEMRMPETTIRTVTPEVKAVTPEPFPPPVAIAGETDPGVKMVNQMDRGDFRTIEEAGIKVPEAEIIGCYNAGGRHTDPEFALITTKKVIYLKDGRTTEFDLKDIANIKNDEAFETAYGLREVSNHTIQKSDPETYHIEVISKQGPRMHIAIKPEKGGALLFDALTKAIQGAGVSLTPG